MKIKRLTLYTGNLSAQKKFYSDILGLVPVREEIGMLSFPVGNTVLDFREYPDATPYHFAINIPSFSEEAALAWLKDRVGILTDRGREIQDFTGWNARSVYFYDADRNIVEFISRRNLGYGFNPPFGPDSFCEVSEIGVATTDIRECYARLHKMAGLTIYDGNLQRFCAIGGETGLIICIDMAGKTWYPTADHAYASNFEALVGIGERECHVSYRDQDLRID